VNIGGGLFGQNTGGGLFGQSSEVACPKPAVVVYLDKAVVVVISNNERAMGGGCES